MPSATLWCFPDVHRRGRSDILLQEICARFANDDRGNGHCPRPRSWLPVVWGVTGLDGRLRFAVTAVISSLSLLLPTGRGWTTHGTFGAVDMRLAGAEPSNFAQDWDQIKTDIKVRKSATSRVSVPSGRAISVRSASGNALGSLPLLGECHQKYFIYYFITPDIL